MSADAIETAGKPPTARLAAAIPLFLVAIACPFLGATILASELPVGTKAWAGLLFFPIPEMFDITAIAILGKPGFAWLKSILFGLLGRYGPPAQVSRVRYRIGLAMFVLPILAGWLHPYLVDRFSTFIGPGPIFHVVGDLVFIASFFVLGGDFWDKVRALFVYGAKARFPDNE
jgi:hypothetical protein